MYNVWKLDLPLLCNRGTLGHILNGMHEVAVSVTRSVTYPLSTWNSMTPTGPFYVRFYILDVH